MAERMMTLEGAHVKVVYGVNAIFRRAERNIVQCLDDYGIPLKLSHTVIVLILTEKRGIKGVTLARK